MLKSFFSSKYEYTNNNFFSVRIYLSGCSLRNALFILAAIIHNLPERHVEGWRTSALTRDSCSLTPLCIRCINHLITCAVCASLSPFICVSTAPVDIKPGVIDSIILRLHDNTIWHESLMSDEWSRITASAR